MYCPGRLVRSGQIRWFGAIFTIRGGFPAHRSVTVCVEFAIPTSRRIFPSASVTTPHTPSICSIRRPATSAVSRLPADTAPHPCPGTATTCLPTADCCPYRCRRCRSPQPAPFHACCDTVTATHSIASTRCTPSAGALRRLSVARVPRRGRDRHHHLDLPEACFAAPVIRRKLTVLALQRKEHHMAVAGNVRPELAIHQRFMRPALLPNTRIPRALDQHRLAIPRQYLHVRREHLQRSGIR